MLRKLVFALTAVAALAVATTASAQEQHGKIGVGVAIATDFNAPTGTAGFPAILLVPINIAPTLRIEPMVGVLTGGAVDNFWLGAGAFFVMRAGGNVDINAGGRLMFNFRDGGPDFQIAAALGGEYFLAPRFSLGAEADLGFYSVNNGNDGLYTQALAMARFYF